MDEKRLTSKVIKLQGIAQELGELAIAQRKAGREDLADRLTKLNRQTTKVHRELSGIVKE